MKTIFALLTIFIIGCSTQFDIGQTKQEIHSWNNYHWPDTSLSITVENKMKSNDWQQYFDETISVWDNEGFNTPLSLTAINNGGMVITEARRSRQWLGLATIYINSEGHITAGKITMNPIMLSDSRYTPMATQHVFCQELGHVLGLTHITAETCMDDCAWAITSTEWLECLNDPNAIGPNIHDEEQLNIIYSHDDVLPDVPDAGDNGGCGNSRRPSCRQKGWVTIHSFTIFDN